MDSRAFCFPPDHHSRRLLESAWFAKPGAAFQREMYECGRELGSIFLASNSAHPASVCVLTQAEDADGIAHGLITYLEEKGVRTRLVCLWNRVERVYEEGISVAPILRNFREPGFQECEQLLAVQSSIGDGAVLKTNITYALQSLDPSKIHVLAPAMHKDTQVDLLSQFPADEMGRYEFHTFVYDDLLIRETGELVPGIGEVGCERYGLPKGKQYLDFPMAVMDALHRFEI
jgi:hypothetical protein